jgi:hypothetical protein
MSGDGKTAIIGGPNHAANNGAAWVFVNNNGTWTQQASLQGTGFTSPALQGWSAALSIDGNTALVGGPGDGNGIGSAWTFTRSNGTWTQQREFGGTDPVGGPQRGYSVALSGDGNTILLGGPFDTGNQDGTGATWLFFPDRAATHDVNGDNLSDIVRRDSSGNVAVWLLSALGFSSSGGLGTVPTTWSIVGQRDFDGDRNVYFGATPAATPRSGS